MRSKREKNQKKEIKSEDREKEKTVDTSRQKKLDKVISFDVYFQKLMRDRPHVLIHHKAPMRKFAEQKGLKDAATEAEFEEAFKLY